MNLCEGGSFCVHLPSAIYATGVLNPGLAFKLAAAFGLAVARDAGFGYRDKPARVKSVHIDERRGARSAHLGPG
jgi:hypothetical protein